MYDTKQTAARTGTGRAKVQDPTKARRADLSGMRFERGSMKLCPAQESVEGTASAKTSGQSEVRS